MVAHLYCTCFDKEELPASLSENVINYLRTGLNFQGVIITDDMNMNGVGKYDALDACTMAINAGVNMFIFRDADNKTLEVIDSLVLRAKNDDNLKNKILLSNEYIKSLKNRALY